MESTPETAKSGKDWFVWSSTNDSVEKGIFSVLACAEVVAAVAMYWLIAILVHSQTHLWLSIAIAPLLLLRSDASVALGVKWFEKFADHGFQQDPKVAIRSLPLWIAVIAAGVAVPIIAYLLASLLPASHGPWAGVLLGALIGYLSSQAGVATAMAIAANELAAVIVWRVMATGIAASTVLAVGLGVIMSGVGVIPTMAAVGTTLVLSTIGARVSPNVRQSLAKTVVPPQFESQGVTAARSMLARQPYSMAVYAPGVFLGGWLRSLGIRFVATLRYFWDGFIALPANWWRTLFVIDFRYPPEIIPGYRGGDVLETSYMLKEIKVAKLSVEWFVLLIAFLIMFVPAYIYRITIKSTCWFYFPLIYIMRERRYKSNPALLADLLWISPFEWWRRILAALVLSAFLLGRGLDKTASVPAEIVTPLEYVFLLDFQNVRPWHWFNISSAVLTLSIFVCVSTLRIFTKHSDKDTSVQSFIGWRSYFIEYAMRLRNISTSIFMLLAFCHVLLWHVPDHLPEYITTLLRRVFA